ncbi:MAG: endo-1,4-beta-xylanase [Chloroflexi bacterium]|nr:endo-1,4-beta-xylanase [Chloroflexota bacterium]
MRWFAWLIIITYLLGARHVMATSDASLRSLADARDKLVGTAVNTTALTNDARYRDFLAREFSSVTPENVMKWQLVEPEQGTPDYTSGDQLVAFARANNQAVRGHTLVWHNQLPEWLTSGGFTSSQLTDMLHAHITDEVSHFAGEISAWDVVNEPFNDDGTWRNSIWYQAMGPDYVALALQWAYDADPAARLYVNDYNTEPLGAKSDAMYALASDLVARGVPLNGVGFQAHLGLQSRFPDTLTPNLQRFADLGLDVAITEADIRMPLPADSDKYVQQAGYFQRLLQSCLVVERCVSFTVWGFDDTHSWVPGAFPGQGAATLLDAAFDPKPAYFALRDALAAGSATAK